MKKFINSDVLKIIAVVTMVIDHLGVVLGSLIPYPAYCVLRGIGRLAFPIFTYLIVEGFRHTRSVPKYIARIAAMALISEIPYDLMVKKQVIYLGHNNILFNFVLVLMVLWIIERYFAKGKMGILICFGATLLAAAAAYFLKLDYTYKCVFLAVIFYILKYDKKLMYAASTLVLVVDATFIGFAAPLALVPIHFYNGEKGKINKYFFYAFYPAHLIILAFVGMGVKL